LEVRDGGGHEPVEQKGGAEHEQEQEQRERRGSPACRYRHRLQYSESAKRQASTSMRLARGLLVAAGMASVAYLVAMTGIDVLVASVRTLSWRLAVFIVMPYAVVA